MTKENVLQNCKIEGNIVKLPEEQLDRKLYLEVAKSLNLIGGKWKGKPVFGFIFQENPTELLEQISNGENKNLKKEFQFFATPDDLADKLVELAFRVPYNLGKILEPSAGQGAIIKAIHRFDPDINVNCCELMDINKSFLDKIENVQFEEKNFLEHEGESEYSTIIANPPFSKNQDIDHIRKMYDCLEPSGRLVSISSEHWQISNNKKETEFRNWLDEVNAEIIDIEKGSFKESGTLIGGNIIVINKP